MSQYLIVSDLLKQRYGKNYGEHMILTTDAAKGNLHKIGVADGLQPVGNHNDVFSWVSSFLFSESTFAAAAAPAQQYTLSIRNGKVNILQTAFRTAQIGKGYIPKFNRCAVTFHIN